MRRRALLLAFLVGGLAVAGTAGLAAKRRGAATTVRRTAPRSARAELADAPAPTAFSRARDAFARDHDDRFNAVRRPRGRPRAHRWRGGWWLAHERAARVRPPLLVATRRTRAPPRQPAIVRL